MTKEQYDNNIILNKSIRSNINYILNNVDERNPIKLIDKMPKVFTDLGIKDYPVYENPSHVRNNILTNSEAKKRGLVINNKKHYHGLGIELFLQVISSLANPEVVFKNCNNRDIFIVTSIKDNNSNSIVVPLETETITVVNNKKIKINRIKSIYAYDRNYPNLKKYINDGLTSGRLIQIYSKKRTQVRI